MNTFYRPTLLWVSFRVFETSVPPPRRGHSPTTPSSATASLDTCCDHDRQRFNAAGKISAVVACRCLSQRPFGGRFTTGYQRHPTARSTTGTIASQLSTTKRVQSAQCFVASLLLASLLPYPISGCPQTPRCNTRFGLLIYN